MDHLTEILMMQKRKQHILFDIDWKGARKIRQNYNKENSIVFILPPSKSELKRRLIKRGRENKVKLISDFLMH